MKQCEEEFRILFQKIRCKGALEQIDNGIDYLEDLKEIISKEYRELENKNDESGVEE